MTTLLIQNKGLVEPEDLKLIGSSTKRGDNTKIGMFGSGWKYALAWLLRNNIDIKIFSGKDEIVIDYEITMHRSSAVRVLTVNGKPTSITSEMGPQWTGWMTLREIISNAIDEGGFKYTVEHNSSKSPVSKDTTSIYIDLNNELGKVMYQYEKYFAFDRQATFECHRGKIYLNSEPSTVSIYRKGIRCFDIPDRSNDRVYTSKLDFNFNNIEINESRVAGWYDIKSQAMKILRLCDHPHIILNALKENRVGSTPSYENANAIKVLIKEGYKFIAKSMLLLTGLSNLQTDEKTVIIPDAWYQNLVKSGILETSFKFAGTIPYQCTNGKDVRRIKYLLSGINLDVEIICARFSGEQNDVIEIETDKYIIRETTTMSDEAICAKILYSMSTSKLETIFK